MLGIKNVNCKCWLETLLYGVLVIHICILILEVWTYVWTYVVRLIRHNRDYFWVYNNNNNIIYIHLEAHKWTVQNSYSNLRHYITSFFATSVICVNVCMSSWSFEVVLKFNTNICHEGPPVYQGPQPRVLLPPSFKPYSFPLPVFT